jgi:hypothetical protein
MLALRDTVACYPELILCVLAGIEEPGNLPAMNPIKKDVVWWKSWKLIAFFGWQPAVVCKCSCNIDSIVCKCSCNIADNPV